MLELIKTDITQKLEKIANKIWADPFAMDIALNQDEFHILRARWSTFLAEYVQGFAVKVPLGDEDEDGDEFTDACTLRYRWINKPSLVTSPFCRERLPAVLQENRLRNARDRYIRSEMEREDTLRAEKQAAAVKAQKEKHNQASHRELDQAVASGHALLSDLNALGLKTTFCTFDCDLALLHVAHLKEHFPQLADIRSLRDAGITVDHMRAMSNLGVLSQASVNLGVLSQASVRRALVPFSSPRWFRVTWNGAERREIVRVTNSECTIL